MTPDLIARLRRDTPACENVIHFNNAGSSLMPAPVWHALTRALEAERDRGGYEAEAALAEPLAAFYGNLATLLRVDRAEIAWVENATRAWDMAVYGLPLAEGDEVLVHISEYASNYLGLLQLVRSKGIRIVPVPSDSAGQIDVAALERAITARTRVIALTHVPTQGGLVNPAAEVGRVARAHGLTYVLDACQSVGQLDVNVAEIGCDILSGTGRKFLRGPRGSGFLYVSRRVLDSIHPPLIDLHAATWTGVDSYDLAPDARRFENFESFQAGRVALGAAAGYALDIGMPVIEARIMSLAADLRARLADLPGVALHDLGARGCGIVTFTCADLPAADVQARLTAQGINVSVSSHALLDFRARGITSLVRASVHAFNTEDEVARVADAVARL
jgi:cysteine desulfurase/selenocysteine lyase